jgi:hypothetical protein
MGSTSISITRMWVSLGDFLYICIVLIHFFFFSFFSFWSYGRVIFYVIYFIMEYVK